MKLLKNAVFYTRYSNSYDMVMPYVYGNVYNDDRFSDSTQIQTTAIIGVEGKIGRASCRERVLRVV